MDERLQELKRRALAGDHEAQLRFATTILRTVTYLSDLSSEDGDLILAEILRLRLFAWLGDKGARAALAQMPPLPPKHRYDRRPAAATLRPITDLGPEIASELGVEIMSVMAVGALWKASSLWTPEIARSYSAIGSLPPTEALTRLAAISEILQPPYKGETGYSDEAWDHYHKTKSSASTISYSVMRATSSRGLLRGTPQQRAADAFASGVWGLGFALASHSSDSPRLLITPLLYAERALAWAEIAKEHSIEIHGEERMVDRPRSYGIVPVAMVQRPARAAVKAAILTYMKDKGL